MQCMYPTCCNISLAPDMLFLNILLICNHILLRCIDFSLVSTVQTHTCTHRGILFSSHTSESSVDSEILCGGWTLLFFLDCPQQYSSELPTNPNKFDLQCKVQCFH